LKVTPAGARQTVPAGFRQGGPCTIVQFILLMMFTTGGITLYQERTRGILRRLASSPVSRTAVVLGKALSRMTIGLLQIAFAMIAGAVVFKVDWGPHVFMVLIVLSAYASLAVLGGMLLGNFGRVKDCSLRSALFFRISWRPSAGAGGRSRSHPTGLKKPVLFSLPGGRWMRCTDS